MLGPIRRRLATEWEDSHFRGGDRWADAGLLASGIRLRAHAHRAGAGGLGFEVAEKMGILGGLRRTGYTVDEFRLVDERGKRIGGFTVRALQSTVGDRYLAIPSKLSSRTKPALT